MDEEAELAALRASSRFQQHQSAFGRAPAAAAGAPSTAASSRGSSIGAFKTPAQRKLDALNAANRSWKARAASTAGNNSDDEGDDEEARRIRAARDSAHDDAEDEAEDDDETGGKKRKTVHSAAAAAAAHSSAAHAASSSSQRSLAASVAVDDDEDAPVIVSDASDAEQALLASMLPTGFGARPKKGPDLTAAHAGKQRKDLGSSLSSGGGAAGAIKVKLEGQQQREETQRPLPRKVTTPAAPPSLLGGSYDSSDDSDAEGKDAAAASSSSAAAAASSSAAAAMSTDDEDDSSDDGAGGGEAGPHPLLRTLPISHEVSLSTNGHTKTVSALTLDKSGSRVLSGGYDYQAKLWDFGGMNESLAAFRTWEPQEGHQVRHLTYSASGDMFLAITGGAQPKLYNRDAAELATFVRGDMYIMDQKLTKGHSTPVTSGWFNPADRSQIVTSGIDGTIRIWDINDVSKNIAVVKPRGIVRGTAVTATAFNKDGKLFGAACSDGSIHIMKPGSRASEFKDDKILSAAHPRGSEPSALLFSADGWSLFSRGGGGMDHTMKHWDLRMIRAGTAQPIASITDLPNVYPETDMCFSPDERVIVTGTGSREVGEKDGSVVFIDRASMKPFQRVSMSCKAIVRSVWHSGINQLLFGCNDGAIRVLYDPSRSSKGVLQCIGRRAKAKPAADFEITGGAIMLPHSLPSMRTDAGGSRKRGREKASAAMAPLAPVKGKVGVGGRAAGSQSMAAFHLSKVVAMRTDPREKDPREALLAMDELAKADPMFFGVAYAATQPKTILAEVPEEERMVALTQEEINLTNKKEGAGKKL